MTKMNLFKNLELVLICNSNSKGTGAAGPTRLPFGPAGQRGPLPLPSLPRARRPPRSTRRRLRGGRAPALDAPRPATPPPWSGRRPAPPDRSLHSVACLPLSLLPPRARAAAAAAPPAPLLEKAPPLAAGRNRAPTSTPRAPAHSPSPW